MGTLRANIDTWHILLSSAVRALGKKRPEVVVPVLREWLDDADEVRQRVAETALGYLE